MKYSTSFELKYVFFNIIYFTKFNHITSRRWKRGNKRSKLINFNYWKYHEFVESNQIYWIALKYVNCVWIMQNNTL